MIVVKALKGQLICPHMYTDKYKMINDDGKEVNISKAISDKDTNKLYFTSNTKSNIKETLKKYTNPDNKYIWLITKKEFKNTLEYPIDIPNFGFLFIDEQTTSNYKKVAEVFTEEVKKLNLSKYDDIIAKNLWDKLIEKLKESKIIFVHSQIAVMLKNGHVRHNGLPSSIQSTSAEASEINLAKIINNYEKGNYIPINEVKNLSLEDMTSLIKSHPRIFLSILRESSIPMNLKEKSYVWFNSKIKTSSLLKKRQTIEKSPMVEPISMPFNSNIKDEEDTCTSCNVRMSEKYLSIVHIYGKPEKMCDECERINLVYYS